MGVAVDSTFLIDLLQMSPSALRKLEDLEARRQTVVLPTTVVYEVLTGILHTRSRTDATKFRGLAGESLLAPLDLPATERAAELRTELLRLGRVKGAADVLTAGTALSGGHSLVTRDRDFQEIAVETGLGPESY